MRLFTSRDGHARHLTDDQPDPGRPAAARTHPRRLRRILPVAAVVGAAVPVAAALGAALLLGSPSSPASAQVERLAPASVAVADGTSSARGIASTRSGGGYWIANADGSVTRSGDATDLGSAAGVVNGNSVVGIAPSASGNGYWLVASDGGVFTYGDATFHGSAGGLPLKAPIVGMEPSPSGQGYWLVASDGGVFTYGDAEFYGSTGSLALNQPIVGLAARPDGDGYWLVGLDGGVFSFGGAPFLGSTGGVALNAPVTHIVSSPTGGGYYMSGADGGVFTFGDAAFGGAGSVNPGQVVISMDAKPAGDGYLLLRADAPPPPPEPQYTIADWVNAYNAYAESLNPDGMWDRMAMCETGGNWAMKGSRYSGGVGFANVTWSRYRDDWMPDNAGDATRQMQIVVADRVLYQAAGGVPSRAWGCARRVGLP